MERGSVVVMTDPNDFFDQIDDADPVTDSNQDSVQSSVEQSEADRLRSSAETSGATSTPRQTSQPRYAARCRFCRQKFRDTWAAMGHKGFCRAEPVSQCRYCNEEHTRGERAGATPPVLSGLPQRRTAASSTGVRRDRRGRLRPRG